MSFFKDHFDHLLLTLLAILGAGAALWANAHGLDKMGEWFTMQSGGCVAALLMRMQGHRGGPSDPLPPPLTPTP